jgi:hypothetical protein
MIQDSNITINPFSSYCSQACASPASQVSVSRRGTDRKSEMASKADQDCMDQNQSSESTRMSQMTIEQLKRYEMLVDNSYGRDPSHLLRVTS